MLCKVIQNIILKPCNFSKNVLKSISCATSLYSTTNSKLLSNSKDLGRDWVPVYRLPIIHVAAAFNKIKIYQFAATLTSPLLFYAESLGYLGQGVSLVFTSLGITGSLTLIIYSLFTKNLIGIVYVKPNSNDVRLSYIDFWGKRKNLETNVDDIIPFEGDSKRWDFYQSIKIKNMKEKFILVQRFGIVSDKERFTYIFGD